MKRRSAYERDRSRQEGKTKERKRENKSANVEQGGDGEKRGVEEMNSLVSVLFAVEGTALPNPTSCQTDLPKTPRAE